MGQNEASNIYNAGQARASGYIGSANALNTALGQIGSYAAETPMRNAMIKYYAENAPESPTNTFKPGGGFGSATRYNLTGQ
jgi:hypothetical protein